MKKLLLLLICLPFSMGTTYYLDPNGSDSNPGTSAEPWLTLSKAQSTMIDGDTVKMRDHTDPNGYGDLVIPDASHSDWRTFEADEGHRPVVTLITAQHPGPTATNLYLRVIGLHVKQTAEDESPVVFRSMQHIKLIDLYIEGDGYTSPNERGVYFNQNCNYVKIEGCEITGKKGQSEYQAFGTGISTAIEADYIDVNSSIIWGCQTAVKLTGRNHSITKSIIQNLDCDGIIIGDCQDILIEDNIICDINRPEVGESNGCHTDPIQVSAYIQGIANITIRRNTIYDIDGQALWANPDYYGANGGSNLLFEGNLIATRPESSSELNNHEATFRHWNGFTVRNNIFDCWVTVRDTSTTGGVFTNNIFRKCTFWGDVGTEDITSDRNLYNMVDWNNISAGDDDIVLNGTWNDPCYLNIFRDYAGIDFSDPNVQALLDPNVASFIQPTWDFHYASPTSLGVNLGTTPYAEAIDGHPRDRTPDLGCYEYVGLSIIEDMNDYIFDKWLKSNGLGDFITTDPNTNFEDYAHLANHWLKGG